VHTEFTTEAFCISNKGKVRLTWERLLAAIVALERTFFVAESHSHKRDFDEDLHDEF
jgi:hypothetical protein